MKERLIELFKAPLPGEKAQFKMAPSGRKDFPELAQRQNAAVLILLYLTNNQLFILFMKRPDYDGVHGGQICFPGGKTESSDKSYKNTALREMSEEIGVKLNEDDIIGELTSLHIPASGYNVHPFVAFLDYKPQWIIDKNEVDTLLEVSIINLLSKDWVRTENWYLHNREVAVPFYYVEDKKIWGATAMITAELLEVLQNLEM